MLTAQLYVPTSILHAVTWLLTSNQRNDVRRGNIALQRNMSFLSGRSDSGIATDVNEMPV